MYPGGLQSGQSLPRLSSTIYFCPTRPIYNAGSKRRFITLYDSHPLDIFKPAIAQNNRNWVYIDNEAKASVLVFTDGAASANGQFGARAGYGVVHDPIGGGFGLPLEWYPNYQPTSNRAELRAAIAAITMRWWPDEGFSRLVIASDSEYVVKGVNEWIPRWQNNGWRAASGKPVKNQDLWIILMERVEELENEGFSVQFFQLKREWNGWADSYAKMGARSMDVPDYYQETRLD